MRRFFLTLLCLLSFWSMAASAAPQIDINHADAKTLAESLVGVGLVKAEAIVAYRAAHGPFRSVDDLAKVKGIGTKTIDANRDAIVIVVEPAPPGAANYSIAHPYAAG